LILNLLYGIFYQIKMRICDVCKKGAVIQKSGAHQYGGGWAMRATKKRKVWDVNLHSAKVTYKGVRCTMRLCTKCLRRVKVEMGKNIKLKSSTGQLTQPVVQSAVA